METRDQLIKLLSDKRESLMQFGVTELGLFGSFARGDQHENSDVDILVGMTKETFRDYMGLLNLLESLVGRKVDLVMKDSIKPMIRNRILSETIYVPGL